MLLCILQDRSVKENENDVERNFTQVVVMDCERRADKDGQLSDRLSHAMRVYML